MPTSLITGGAGSSAPTSAITCSAKGHRVICVDNVETGSLNNIAHLREPETSASRWWTSRATTRSTSRSTSSTTWPRRPVPIDYARLPLHTLKVGAYGTHNALGLAKVKRARFLIASTSEVYGDPLVHPQPETYWGNVNPIGPRGVYDEAKRYAEALTMAYLRQQGVDTAHRSHLQHLRPAHARRTTAARSPRSCTRRCRDKPLTVFGDGSQTRSFCYVDDLIRGLVAARRVGRARAGEHRQPDRDDAARDGADSRGDDRVALARSCSRRCPSTTRRCASPTSRARAILLGWEPQVELRDGLRKTIDYAVEHLSSGRDRARLCTSRGAR